MPPISSLITSIGPVISQSAPDISCLGHFFMPLAGSVEKLKVKFSKVPVPNLLICGVFFMGILHSVPTRTVRIVRLQLITRLEWREKGIVI